MNVQTLAAELKSAASQLTAAQIASRNLWKTFDIAGLGERWDDREFAFISIQNQYGRDHVRVGLEHNLREGHAENADASLPTEERIEILGKPGNRAETVEEGMERLEAALEGARVYKNKHQKSDEDAALTTEYVIKGQRGQDKARFREYVTDGLRFLCRELGYPPEAIISAVIHWDETQYHAHIKVANRVCRLSGQGLRQVRERGKDPANVKREVVISRAHYLGPKRTALHELQNKWFAFVGEKYGLDRGLLSLVTGAKKLTGKEWQEFVQHFQRSHWKNDDIIRGALGRCNEVIETIVPRLEKKEAELDAGLSDTHAEIARLHRDAQARIARDEAKAREKTKKEALAEAAETKRQADDYARTVRAGADAYAADKRAEDRFHHHGEPGASFA
jgi:hypothetical protein